MRVLLLVTTLALAESRPQDRGIEGPVSIEIEKHEVLQVDSITPTLGKEGRELDDIAQEILKKIEDINQKYGYTTEKSPARSTDLHIPHFYEHSYDRPLPVRLGNFLQKKTPEKEDVRKEKQMSNDERHNFIQSQMLNNVKGIILKSQLPPYIQGLSNFNPLVQNLPFLNSFTPYRKSENYESSGYINNVPNMPFNEYKVDGYRPDRDIPKNTKPVENGNTGIFNYLRILFDMEKNMDRNASSERTGKQFLVPRQGTKPKFIIESIKEGIRVAEYNEGPVVKSPRNIDVEKAPRSNSAESRTKKDRKKEKTDENKNLNVLQSLLQQHMKNRQSTTTTTQQTLAEEADGKDVINEHNKKVLSKDNIGSGIFIHRIKVKKGGVAIAGPGGIATAGSGGTAIVGPNGYAYTHPDSLAIAGTGSKVIAVEPDVSLSDIINGNHKGKRVGKIVAVGPVIYYNKGWLSSGSSGSLYQTPSTLTTNNGLWSLRYPHHFYELLPPNVVKPRAKPEKLLNHEPSADHRVVEKEEFKVGDVLRQRQEKVEELAAFEDTIKELNAKVAPYKVHPLLHYLKSRETVDKGKVIRFRDHEDGDDTITLVLKPVARAIAGQEGKAIANPVSRAILRQGTNVDVLFEPDAVAIAGPGGIAHAESDLEINYEEA